MKLGDTILVKIAGSNHPARRATLVGESRDKRCWRVKLLERLSGKLVNMPVRNYHKSFCQPID